MRMRLTFFILALLLLPLTFSAQAQQPLGLTRGTPMAQIGVSGTAARAPRTPLPAQTFTVNSTLDLIDIDLMDNMCASMNGQCTLRAAIQSANAAPGSTVLIPAGVFQLAIGGRGEGLAANGDLDIYADMTIVGAGAHQTVINGGKLDGVLHIFTVKSLPTDPNINVTISGLKVTNGRNISTLSTEITGGGITIENANATLNGVHIAGNSAYIGAGMQIGGTSTVSITNSTINNNVASSFSGGIDVFGGATVNVTNSTISGNTASTGGGVLVDDAGTVTNATLIHVTIAYNKANGSGGGLRSKLTATSASSVSFGDSIIAYNTAKNAPDCVATVDKPFISLGGSVVKDATLCRGFDTTNDLQADPLLRPLTLNMPGTTPTHVLKLNSPAVDRAGACAINDQRGVARPFGAACDAGATEQIPADVPAPGAFVLLSPSNLERFSLGEEVTELRWQAAVDATTYTLTLARTAPDALTILDAITVNAATACSTGTCVYEFTPAEQAFVVEGQYQWNVIAHNLGGSTSADAPFVFLIDRRLVRLIRNPSFELNTTTDPKFVTDFWRKNSGFGLNTPDNVVKDRRELAYRGCDVLMFAGVSPHARRVTQGVGRAIKPEIAEMEPGDMLYFSFAWRGCNFSNLSEVRVTLRFIDPRDTSKNLLHTRRFVIPSTCNNAELWRVVSRQFKVPTRVKAPSGELINVSELRSISVQVVHLNYDVELRPRVRENLYIDNVSLIVDLEPEFTPILSAPAPNVPASGGPVPLPPPPQ